MKYNSAQVTFRWCEAGYSCLQKNILVFVRKYNVPETSEVALVGGKKHGKLEIVPRRHSEFDVNRFKKLESINLGHLMYNPLAYPLLLPCGKDVWHCVFKHKDLKGNSRKVSPTVPTNMCLQCSPSFRETFPPVLT